MTIPESSQSNDAHLSMFIIDVLRYDIEQIGSIVTILNDRSIGWRDFWPRDFTEKDVLPGLEELVRMDLVRPLQTNESLNELVDIAGPVNIWEEIGHLWFLLTNKGWQAWEKWTPPPEP